MQQILTALSYGDNIPGSTDYAKQTALKNQQNQILQSQGETASDTGVVAYMATVMNSYLPSNLYYWYNVSTDVDYENFTQYTYNSLSRNRPVIIQADTSKLDYYGGTRYSHYIVIDYVDLSSEKMETADCCWNDNYRGRFMVDSNEAYEAAKSQDGNNPYIICLSQSS